MKKITFAGGQFSVLLALGATVMLAGCNCGGGQVGGCLGTSGCQVGAAAEGGGGGGGGSGCSRAEGFDQAPVREGVGGVAGRVRT